MAWAIARSTPATAAGLTPNGSSDYTALNDAGVLILAVESARRQIGDPHGYEQAVDCVSFWYTPRDTLETIEAVCPERPMVRLNPYARLASEFLWYLDL